MLKRSSNVAIYDLAEGLQLDIEDCGFKHIVSGCILNLCPLMLILSGQILLALGKDIK